MLSFADVEDMYKVTHKNGKSFMAHLPEQDLVFHRKKKLYLADFLDIDRHLYLTKAYMKGEEACTKLAYDLVCLSRYPSLQEAIHLVKDGNMTHVPGITADDMKRSFEIFGEPVGSIRGKMT
jgi:hypothetical protein